MQYVASAKNALNILKLNKKRGETMKINYRCYVSSLNCYVDLVSINLENQEVKFKNNEKLCSLSFDKVVLQRSFKK